MTDKKVYSVILRIPDKELKNQIKKVAKENGRSLNSEILMAIKSHLPKPYLTFEKESNLPNN